MNRLIELRYTNVYETLMEYNRIQFELSIKNARIINRILFFLGCAVFIVGIISAIDFISHPKGIIYVPFLEASGFLAMITSGGRLIRINSSKTSNTAYSVIDARLNASKTTEISYSISETHLCYSSYSIKTEIAWELINSYSLYQDYLVFNHKNKNTIVYLLNKKHLTENDTVLIEQLLQEKGLKKL